AEAQTETRPDRSAASTPAITRLVNVHKSFGPQRVLRGFDFAAETGRTTVVLGPSGVGKSVVLKHIAGLLKPDSGEVWFRDERIDSLRRGELDDVRRHMGFLFQMAALFDSMTVEDNVAFPLVEHLRLRRREVRDRAARALETVGLSGVQKKMPGELSGGQKKRVALARAIILEPDLVLYDEPTTGLDPVLSDGINQLINKLRDELGVTGVVVTHDLVSCEAISDKVVMILDGVVAAEGRLEELRASPDERVRRFLAGRYDPQIDQTPGREAEA
ncbi:MAG: ATP-binding cassette domain-containing protein, partial [Planctomycetota bacterium]|nr:ATP-binding cassette domain-containing protein [Planctomycetota bacterium]